MLGLPAVARLQIYSAFVLVLRSQIAKKTPDLPAVILMQAAARMTFDYCLSHNWSIKHCAQANDEKGKVVYYNTDSRFFVNELWQQQSEK